VKQLVIVSEYVADGSLSDWMSRFGHKAAQLDRVLRINPNFQPLSERSAPKHEAGTVRDSIVYPMLESATMTVTLRPGLEEELAVRAQAEGLSIEEFVNRELARLVASSPSSKLTPEERVCLWDEFLASHSVGGPPLSDYAVSRESIYTREDEML
jgi:hypothetical protein